MMRYKRSKYTENKPARTEVYVAVNGSDETGDGSYENPYGTIWAAQSAVRAAIRDGGLKKDAHVYIREGTYYLSESIHIGQPDFDADHHVVYTNYKDEKVRIVGGIPITAWTDPDGDGIFEADITNIGDFYALYENGKRLLTARDTDWAHKVVADSSHLQAVYSAPTSWYGEVLKIKAIEGETAQTYLRKCEWSGALQYVQGAREYIDEAGEWAIEWNKVYYKPADPSTFGHSEIVAGVVNNLFVIDGWDGMPVKNITIRGLHLTMNNFGENLSAHSNARGNEVPTEIESNIAALVYLNNTENITVKDCYLDNAGYVGITLNHYSQNNTIFGNYITDTGFAGIFMIGENPGSLNYCNRCNTISNNRIDHVGNFVGHGAGIYMINSGENTVTHNEISNVPRYGISMKGMRYGTFAENGLGSVPFEDHWKYNQTTKNLIAYNKVYNTGIRSGDGGGIAGWGIGRDNIIDHNIVYNAYCGPAAEGWRGHSIFLDDGSHHVTVTNNIVYDENAVAVNAGIMIKSIGNYVVNNIFDIGYAKHGAADIHTYICPAGDSTFKNNIVYSSTTGTLHPDGSMTDDGDSNRAMYVMQENTNPKYRSIFESFTELNYNLYYNAAGKVLFDVDNELLSFEDWQNHEKNVSKYESDSIVADPLFAAPQNHDYTLREDSPALALGFTPIDTSEIGLLSVFKY